jgi:hypothetical protein
MRKLIIFIAAAFAFAACKPETYTGPLDSPVGNWDGVKTEYYFNGEFVAEAEGCPHTAISFYPEGLCCIEGVKGAFPYTYDNASGMLQIDSTLFGVRTLTGLEFVIEYIETIFPEEAEEPEVPEVPEAKPDENGIILPVEYEGLIINADNNGYYYEVGVEGTERVYCNFFGGKDEAGTMIIDFWYDNYTAHYIPLVVEPKK